MCGEAMEYQQDLGRRFSTAEWWRPDTATWDREAVVNLSAASPRPRTPAAVQTAVTDDPLQRTLSLGRRTSTPGSFALEWSQSRKILEADLALAQQQATSPAPPPLWDPATWASGEQLLEQRLNKLNLDMHVMAGDGNCQFRAVSFGLHGTDRYHMAVRQRAVDYIVAHRPEFESFLGAGEFARYVQQMARSGVWGDELTLRAISETYGAVINLVTSDQKNWVLRYVPQKAAPRRELFLTYIAPVHYNAIRRRPLTQAVRQKLTRRHSRLLRTIEQYQAVQCVPENPAELAAIAEAG